MELVPGVVDYLVIVGFISRESVSCGFLLFAPRWQLESAAVENVLVKLVTGPMAGALTPINAFFMAFPLEIPLCVPGQPIPSTV